MIRVLKIEPGSAPETVTMPNTLEAFQEAVGGYIEALWLGCGVCFICNEEGKLRGLPYNRPLLDESGLPMDILQGTFFVTGVDGERFTSLTDEQIQRYKDLYDNVMIITAEKEPPHHEKSDQKKKRGNHHER